MKQPKIQIPSAFTEYHSKAANLAKKRTKLNSFWSRLTQNKKTRNNKKTAITTQINKMKFEHINKMKGQITTPIFGYAQGGDETKYGYRYRLNITKPNEAHMLKRGDYHDEYFRENSLIQGPVKQTEDQTEMQNKYAERYSQEMKGQTHSPIAGERLMFMFTPNMIGSLSSSSNN